MKKMAVYCGANVGLMGAVADTLLAEGGEVIGVMPTFLMEREIAHNGITKMHTVSDMHARKKKMIELADVYLALPGGPGTLEEISEVISWGRVGEHMNPCNLYNVNGYYDLLAAFFDKMVETSFLTAADRAKIFISDSLEEICAFIDSYEPPMVRQYKK